MADQGRFVWYDLMTNDKEKALAFYRELFGWKAEDVDMGAMGTYTMIGAGERSQGGIVHLDPSHGVPSHWIAYVTVPDVDEASRTAAAAGGQVPVPPTDIPNVGRFAVVRDPQGAHISPFRFSGEGMPEAEGAPGVGTFCWNELLTRDVEAAQRFYAAVFGWSWQAMDMGEAGTYYIFKRGEKDAAGLMAMPPEAQAPPFWLPYVLVQDVDASAARAAGLGATIHVPPRDIPGIGRFSVLSDPTGASVALFAAPSA